MAVVAHEISEQDDDAFLHIFLPIHTRFALYFALFLLRFVAMSGYRCAHTASQTWEYEKGEKHMQKSS